MSSEECSKRLEAVIQEKGLMASQLQQQKEALCQENEELISSSAKLQYAGVARQAADRALLRETSKQTEGLKMALEEAGVWWWWWHVLNRIRRESFRSRAME